jgi:transglutaminase-like putative cysteine protease
VRYVRERPGLERWQTARETYLSGEGDCEDLSIYLARDLRMRGFPARVVIKRTRSGGLHALVGARINRKYVLLDPSKARGM